MKKYNISTDLIRVIINLYNKATSAVLFKSTIGDCFWTTVGVRQGCLVSPSLFKIFLQRIITDALDDHESTVSTEGRTITNLCFTDNIDGLAGEQELTRLVELLDKASTAYGHGDQCHKDQADVKEQHRDQKVNGQKFKAVTSFSYLCSVITVEDCKPKILARIAQAPAALLRCKPVCNDRSISPSPKIRLKRSLVTYIFLYKQWNEVLPQDSTHFIQRLC